MDEHLEDLFSDGLFQEPPLHHIRVGEHVMLQMIWGEERARVEQFGTDVDGWPTVTATITSSGDRVTVARSSVHALQ